MSTSSIYFRYPSFVKVDEKGNPVPKETNSVTPEEVRAARDFLQKMDEEDREREKKKFDINNVDWARVGTAAGGAWLSHWLASSLFGDYDEDENRPFWSKVLSKIIPLGAAGVGAYGGWKIPDLVKFSSNEDERARALSIIKQEVQDVVNDARTKMSKTQGENIKERKEKLLDIGGNVVGGGTGAILTIDGARRWLNARGDARVQNEYALADKGVTEARKALADAVLNAKTRGSGSVEDAIIGTQSAVRAREMDAAGRTGTDSRVATAITNEARDTAKAKQDRATADAASVVEAEREKATADLDAAKRRLAEAKDAVKFRGAPSKRGRRPKMTETQGRGVFRKNPNDPWKPGLGHKVELGVGVPLLGWNLYKGIVNKGKLDEINTDIDEVQSEYETWIKNMDQYAPGWRDYVDPNYTPPKR